jgi:sec-independent protein translocase protein TatB
MFDIGFGELMVIAIVALVVLGPERLPKAARFAGLWIRRARAQWDSVKVELERELEAEEIKRNLQSARAALQETQRQLRESQTEAQHELDMIRTDASVPAADAPAAVPASTTEQEPHGDRPERS